MPQIRRHADALRQGASDPVVLLPCSASTARQWDPLALHLGEGFRPQAIDLIGHGKARTWPGDGPLTLAAEGAAVAAAAAADAPIHLIGHSYGGAVALRFAASHGSRLRSLTLIEPSCFHLLKGAGAEAALLHEVQSVATAVKKAVTCGDYRAAMAIFVDYWNGAGSWAALPEDKKAKLARKAIYVSHHYWSLIDEPTPLTAYAQIEVPTLLLCGTRSPPPSRAITRLLAESLPRAKHRTIRGANHMSPLTHGPIVNPLILDHVAAHGPAGRGAERCRANAGDGASQRACVGRD